MKKNYKKIEIVLKKKLEFNRWPSSVLGTKTKPPELFDE